MEDKNLISYDDALSILLNKYVGKVIKIVGDEFDEGQLVTYNYLTHYYVML